MVSWLRIGLIIVLGLGLACGLSGCGKRDGYSQESPEEVLATALAMIKNGEANKLTRLIYADSREYRSVLNRLGSLLGNLQKLGVELKNRFPEDVEKLRKELVRVAAESPDNQKIGAALNTEAAPGAAPSIPRDRAAQRRQRQQFEDLSQRILTNPFLFIEANAERLSAEKITDDIATVKLDGQPLLAGVFQMQKREGQWWLILPLELPGVSSFAPKTRNEWSIIGSLIKMADGVVVELTEDVRSGAISKVGQLATKAGEKAFLPGAMIFIVYGKEMDVRRQRERAMRGFRTRAREWGNARVEAGDERAAVDLMIETLGKVGVERLDEVVRARSVDREKNPLPKWEEMPEADFLALMGAWLSSVGDKEPIGTVTEGRAKRAQKAADANLRGTIKPVTAYR